ARRFQTQIALALWRILAPAFYLLLSTFFLPPVQTGAQLAPATIPAPGAAAAQTTPPAMGSNNAVQRGKQFVLKAQTNVVLVDVRVTDKHGQPVTDLKSGDFRVLEDGVPQNVTSFSLEDIAALVSAKAEKGGPAIIDLGKLPAIVSPAQVNRIIQDHRLLVLFFDLTSMQPDDLM